MIVTVEVFSFLSLSSSLFHTPLSHALLPTLLSFPLSVKYADTHCLIHNPSPTYTHTHTISLSHTHTTSLRYWSALLKNIDTDIVSFDVYVNPKKCWTSVHKGGPDMLLDPDLQGKSVAVSFDFFSNLNFHFFFMSFPLSKSFLILIMILFFTRYYF